MGIFDKAKDFASNNPDKVGQGIDKAGDMIDEKTGGKYTSQVDQGQDFARGQFGAGQAEAPAPEGAPEGQAPEQQGGFDAPQQQGGFDGQQDQQGGFDAPQGEQHQQGGFDAPQGDVPPPEGEQQQF